jgi:hypothetical protein
MSKQQKQNWIDQVADQVRDFIDDLDSLLKPKQEPVPIPVPVRNTPPPPMKRRRR